jgi:hypothetical protein
VGVDTLQYTTPAQQGMLFGYFKNFQIFRCPSYPKGQVGYAMSYITVGPKGKPDAKVINPAVYFVWDHAKTPGCADTYSPDIPTPAGGTWLPFPWLPSSPTAPAASWDSGHTHYPIRHVGGFVGLCYDGHAKWKNPSSLLSSDFDSTQTP